MGGHHTGMCGRSTDNKPKNKTHHVETGCPSGNGPLNVTSGRLGSIGTAVIVDALEWGSIVCRDEVLGKENPGDNERDAAVIGGHILKRSGMASEDDTPWVAIK